MAWLPSQIPKLLTGHYMISIHLWLLTPELEALSGVSDQRGPTAEIQARGGGHS